MLKKFISSLILSTCWLATAHAQGSDNLFDLLAQAHEDQWETHFGFGLSFNALGNPSQIYNKLAFIEEYAVATSELQGLPMGLNLFTGVGYKVSPAGSMGIEIGAGIHADGGKARAQLGDTVANPNAIPGYAYDLIYGNTTNRGEFGLGMALQAAPQVNQWLSVKSTMKGFYLDPKVRLYYRYTQPKWNIQTGVGGGLIIPFGYYIYPSKDPLDSKKFGITDPMQWPMAQNNLQPIRVPFPLTLRDGTTMMRAFQPVADFHVRAAYKLTYLELGYATNFMHIHNLKIAIGVNFI